MIEPDAHSITRLAKCLDLLGKQLRSQSFLRTLHILVVEQGSFNYDIQSNSWLEQQLALALQDSSWAVEDYPWTATP